MEQYIFFIAMIILFVFRTKKSYDKIQKKNAERPSAASTQKQQPAPQIFKRTPPPSAKPKSQPVAPPVVETMSQSGRKPIPTLQPTTMLAGTRVIPTSNISAEYAQNKGEDSRSYVHTYSEEEQLAFGGYGFVEGAFVVDNENAVAENSFDLGLKTPDDFKRAVIHSTILAKKY